MHVSDKFQQINKRMAGIFLMLLCCQPFFALLLRLLPNKKNWCIIESALSQEAVLTCLSLFLNLCVNLQKINLFHGTLIMIHMRNMVVQFSGNYFCQIPSYCIHSASLSHVCHADVAFSQQAVTTAIWLTSFLSDPLDFWLAVELTYCSKWRLIWFWRVGNKRDAERARGWDLWMGGHIQCICNATIQMNEIEKFVYKNTRRNWKE